MQVIIYKQENGSISVMYPSDAALKKYSVYEVGVKSVPAGKPFAIVNASDLPQDIPQEAWLVDDADLTDGIGGESNEF